MIRNRYIRIVLTGVAILLLFLILVFILIRVPAVQNYAQKKVFQSLSEQYDAEWHIDKLKFSFIDKVEAEGILLKDQASDTMFSVKQLTVDISLFSLLGKKISFDEIAIDDASINLYELAGGDMNYSFLMPVSNENAEDVNTSSPVIDSWDIDFHSINLNKVELRYKTKDLKLVLTQEELLVDIDEIDFAQQKVSIDKFLSKNDYTYLSLADSDEQASLSLLPDMGWTITLDDLDLNHKLVEIEDEEITQISELDIVAENLDYQSGNLVVDIKKIKADYNNQIKLKEGSVQLSINQNRVVAKQLKLLTRHDQIAVNKFSVDLDSKSYDATDLYSDISFELLKMVRPYLPNYIKMLNGSAMQAKARTLHYDPRVIILDQIDLKYGSALSAKGSMDMKASDGDFQNMEVMNIYLDSLEVDLHQVDNMLSAYKMPDSLSRYNHLSASGRADGNLKSLSLDDFSLRIDDDFETEVQGTLQNIDAPDLLSYDLVFERLNINTLDFPYAFPEELSIQALEQLNYTGSVSGDRTATKLEGKLQSAIGYADANIALGYAGGIKQLTYKGDLALTQFDLGALLKNENLGKVTLATELDGQGVDIQEGNSKLKGVINDFEFRGYTYNIVSIDAHMHEGQVDGLINVDDPNAKLQYDGTFSMGEENSVFDFSIDIDTINLFDLNLYQDKISLSGSMKSHIRLPLSSRNQQELMIENLYLSNPIEHFYEDSISIVAISKSDSTFLSLSSDALQLKMDGIYQLQDLPGAINDIIASYNATDTFIGPNDISSKGIHLYGKLNTLMPVNVLLVEHQLQSKPMSLDVKVDFDQKLLAGEVEVDSFFYDDFFSEHILLTVANDTSDASILNLRIIGDMNSYNGTPVNNLTIKNRIKKGSIASTVTARDRSDNKMLELSSNSQFNADEILVTVEDNVILNNKDWKIQSGNFISIQDNCFSISNFELTDGNAMLSVNSDVEDGERLSVEFKNFEMGELADLILNEGHSATGTVNGEIDLMDFCKTPYFIANIEVEDIVYDSTSIGTLTISGDSDPVNSILKSEIKLAGLVNRVEGSAEYNTLTNQIDMNVLIDSLQLFLIEPFIQDIIKNTQGQLTGELNLSGKAQSPSISGFAQLHNTVTTIVANNTEYSLFDHKINFDDRSIDVGVLDIYDEEGNTAQLTGKIYHNKLQDVTVDLRIDTDKFIFLNTSFVDNPVFYGKAFLKAQGSIVGPPDLLKVDVSAKSLPATAITISPYDAESYLREDFITYGRPQEFEDLTDAYFLQLAQALPFDVTLLLEVTEESKLTLVVDPINGDKVEGYGSGNLRIQINPDGEQEFYGRYLVKQGIYTFSYGTFIFKEFEIRQGGSVQFNGSLLDAVVNIAAVHNVYTTTYELVKDEVTLEAEATDLSKFKSRTNVEVFLTLMGPLDDTEILLDIRIPELESSSLINPVVKKLEYLRDDPNELNNQVFGLLIFNSFIISQNSSFGIGSVGSNLALSSISELISSKLNNFAQNMIKGVDVNINVNSYNSEYVNSGSGGNVTEVGLQLSKQLFNDRLSVSAAGNVDLENNDQEGYSTVVGDFVLEYKLTMDGRYRVRVFSKSDYDRLLNENNSKNGVSLYFSKSFDSKVN